MQSKLLCCWNTCSAWGHRDTRVMDGQETIVTVILAQGYCTRCFTQALTAPCMQSSRPCDGQESRTQGAAALQPCRKQRLYFGSHFSSSLETVPLSKKTSKQTSEESLHLYSLWNMAGTFHSLYWGSSTLWKDVKALLAWSRNKEVGR